MPVRRRLVPAVLVAAAAATGAAAVTPGARAWYEALDKPSWQPGAKVFPLVWAPLYAGIAWAGVRAAGSAPGPGERRRPAAYCANLALNAAWTWIFFRARRPVAALAEAVVLHASSLDLLRRYWRADRAAGAALLPYAAWTGFAAVLNAAVVRRNRPGGPSGRTVPRPAAGAPGAVVRRAGAGSVTRWARKR